MKHTRTEVETSFNNDKHDTKETSVIDVDEYSNVQETWGALHFYGSKEDKRKQKNASRSSNKNADNSIPKV